MRFFAEAEESRGGGASVSHFENKVLVVAELLLGAS